MNLLRHVGAELVRLSIKSKEGGICAGDDARHEGGSDLEARSERSVMSRQTELLDDF